MPKKVTPLSALEVRQAKPKAKPYKLYDGAGLFVLVTPSGGKYWRLRYRFEGKEKLLALAVDGDGQTMTVIRKKAEQARSLIASGVDPIQDKRAKELAAEAARKKAQAESFRVIALEWHEAKSESWSEKHAARTLDSLEKNVFPEIGTRPVSEITPPEVLALVRKIEARGARELNSRVLQRVRAVMDFAVQTGRATSNPAAALSGALKTRAVEHRPALSREQLPEFLRRLDSDDFNGKPLTALALKLLMLTFVRPGELTGAQWSEFDLEGAEWRIPSERMKMREEHIVPLSRQALDVVEQIREHSGGRTLLFPGYRDHRKPFSNNTLLFAMYRLGYRREATAHGFRATASTILNEEGFAPDVIERQLAHAQRNKVRAAYNRAQYLDDRRRMMQWWSDFIDSMQPGARVVPMRVA